MHARVQYNTGPLACLLCLLTAPEIGFDGLPDKLFSHFISFYNFYLVRCNYDGSFVGVRFGRAMRAWLPSSGGGEATRSALFPPHTSGRRMRTCVARRGAVREILFSHAVR